MKAKFVYESVNFKRGKDPKTAMGIGDQRAQYEKKMNHFLSEFDRQAEKFGFVDDMDTHIKNWGADQKSFDSGSEVEYYIRSYVKPPTMFNPRTPRVKLGLRELLDWDKNSYSKESMFYIVYSHNDHPVDEPGEAWTSFDTDSKLIEWVTDRPWEKLLKKEKIHKFDRGVARRAKKEARRERRAIRKANESVNFERGLDPRAAMGIGVINKRGVHFEGNRIYKGSKQLMTISDIADALYLYGNSIDDDYLKIFRFPAGADPIEFVVRSEEGEPVDYDEGYKKISYAEILTLFLELVEDDPEFPSFVAVRVVSHDLKKWDPLIESVNFERGKDPKSAMGIGVMDGYKKMMHDTSVEDRYGLVTHIRFFIRELNLWYEHLRSPVHISGEKGEMIYKGDVQMEPLEIFLEWAKLAEEPEFREVIHDAMGPIVNYGDPTDSRPEEPMNPEDFLLPRKPKN